MDQNLIIQTLKAFCGNRNFKFQVIIQSKKLHIYANHRQDYQPNYNLLQDNVTSAIISLKFDSLEEFWLYCRPLSQVDPNWKTHVPLSSAAIAKIEVDTIGKTVTIESTAKIDSTAKIESTANIDSFFESKAGDANSLGDTGLLHAHGVAHKNSLPEEEIALSQFNTDDLLEEFDYGDFANVSDQVLNVDSVGDTGLLRNTGLVHGTPLKQEEIITGFMPKVAAEETADEAISLSKFCFIANRKLLTEDTSPPGKEIRRLIKFFHHLSPNDQKILLPDLESYFNQGENPGIDSMAIPVQKWFLEIKELDSAAHQIAAIWLSRYCFAPEKTLEEFKVIAAEQDAEAKAKNTASHGTEYSFTPSHENPDSVSQLQNQISNESEDSKFEFSLLMEFIVPVVWVMATIICIGLGILGGSNPQASAIMPEFCSSASGSPEMCRLAVNLAGEKRISQNPVSLFPLTDVTEQVATYGCGRYANLKAGIPVENIAPETTPVVASVGEKILPHIFVIQAKQQNYQGSGATRVGCVYTTGRGQRSPKKLAADVIPLDWPAEAYGASPGITLGQYSNPINLGLFTIFAAIGIGIVSRLRLGISISRSASIYLLALLLGIVQLIVTKIQFWGLLGSAIFPLVAMLGASLLLKDFQLNWSRGALLVFTSMLMVITIQYLFYSFAWEMLSALA